MRYTSTIKLKLPDLNSKMNWGDAVNYNFSLLDREIQKLTSELSNTKTLLGVGIPYYKELYITDIQGDSVGPYKFVEILDNSNGTYNFKYWTNIINSSDQITGSGASVEYSTSIDADNSVNTLPSNVGAYVINDSITITSNNMAITYKQGDLIVAVSKVSSLIDTSVVNTEFIKFPETGFFIEPSVVTDSQSSYLSFAKRNYLYWYSKADTNNDNEYLSPSPTFYFIEKILTNPLTYSFTGGDNVSIQANFYYKNTDGTRSEFYIPHTIKWVQTDDVVTVTVQLKNSYANDNAICVLCIGTKTAEMTNA